MAITTRGLLEPARLEPFFSRDMTVPSRPTRTGTPQLSVALSFCVGGAVCRPGAWRPTPME